MSGSLHGVRLREHLRIDTWSGLSFKAIFGGEHPSGRSTTGMAPTWVGRHGRRLDAYRILAAYVHNVGREMLPSDTDADDEGDTHREYGDPVVLVRQVRAALLADMRIQVEGAEAEPPDPPTALPDGATDEQRADFAARTAAWRETMAGRPLALKVQEWFDDWVEAAKFRRVIVQGATREIGMGDGVYLTAWSGVASRPKARTYDPGFFFPVEDPFADDDEFPRRVHIGWQEWIDDPLVPRNRIEIVRRITFELVDLADPAVDLTGREALLEPLPWEQSGGEDDAGEGAARSTLRCFMSDGWWRLADLGDANDPDRFPMGKVTWLTDPDDPTQVLDHKPLGIDFVPIVHVPNTVPDDDDFWGESLLTSVAQIFDDLSSTDSDLSAVAARTGSPMVALIGGAGVSDQALEEAGGPGGVWKAPEGGDVKILDVSKSLDALLGQKDNLLARLSTNARVPEEILGRVNASEVPSGVAMALAFGPFQSLVDDMRLVRQEKYGLLLKFVARLAQLNGDLPAGRLPKIELTFGSYLPSDLNGTITLLLAAYQAHAISRATFLRLAAQAGLELDNLVEEEARARSEDFVGAGALADATGSDAAAADYLGVKVVEPRQPAVTPPAGGTAPAAGGAAGQSPPSGPGAPTNGRGGAGG